MDFHTEDYLKKTLLDTQERIRDFRNYADRIPDKHLQQYFREYAESEGRQAQQLRSILEQREQ